MKGLAVVILLLGGLLRLYMLGTRGFWGDEIWTAQASTSQLTSIFQYYLSYPGPLTFLLGHAALRILGDVPLEFALRWPSTIASVLCLAVFFVLAYRYAGGAGALVGMLLLAVAPYQVWYAQEARFYAWSTLLALLGTYALVRALDEPPRNRYWLVFGLANVANLYNQPLPAVLLLLGQSVLIGIWLLLSPSHRPIIGKALVMYVLIAAAYWPVIQRVIITGRMDAFNSETFLAYQDFAFWLALADTVHITVDQFAAGGVTAWVYLTLFLGGLLAVARQRQWKLFALALAPPLAAVLLFAIARPRTGFLVRYALYAQPFYYLGIAAGIRALAGWSGATFHRVAIRRGTAPPGAAGMTRIITVGLVALLTAVSLLQVRQSYSRAKINDWRAVARYVDAHVQPGDLIVGSRWFKDALGWYLQRRDQVTMSVDDNPAVLEDLAHGRRLWYLQLGPATSDVSLALRRSLPVIAPMAWQDATLDYAADSFFPISEPRVKVRLSEGGPTAVARFYDEMPSAPGGNSYRILLPGEQAVVQLALPADGGARVLTVSYYHNARTVFTVTVDGLEPTTLRGPAGVWSEARIPIAAGAGDTVTVRVQSSGEHPGRLHALRLAPVYRLTPRVP